MTASIINTSEPPPASSRFADRFSLEETPAPEVRLPVEYWTVTMAGQASCGSCDETLTTVTNAVDEIRPLARRLGIGVDLVPRTVETWAEAVDHGIVASPTIRACGSELRPAHADDSETRSWQWRGSTATSASTEALLDLLVRALATRSGQLGDYLASGGPAPYVRRYLRAAPAAEGASGAEAAPVAEAAASAEAAAVAQAAGPVGVSANGGCGPCGCG